MSETRQPVQPSREAIISMVIDGRICPLPGSEVWKMNFPPRPKYVWADMSSPGEEPPVVTEWYERAYAFQDAIAEQRLARTNYLRRGSM